MAKNFKGRVGMSIPNGSIQSFPSGWRWTCAPDSYGQKCYAAILERLVEMQNVVRTFDILMKKENNLCLELLPGIIHYLCDDVHWIRIHLRDFGLWLAKNDKITKNTAKDLAQKGKDIFEQRTIKKILEFRNARRSHTDVSVHGKVWFEISGISMQYEIAKSAIKLVERAAKTFQEIIQEEYPIVAIINS